MEHNLDNLVSDILMFVARHAIVNDDLDMPTDFYCLLEEYSINGPPEIRDAIRKAAQNLIITFMSEGLPTPEEIIVRNKEEVDINLMVTMLDKLKVNK